MGQIIPFPQTQRAVARPPRLVRGTALVLSLGAALAAVIALITTWPAFAAGQSGFEYFLLPLVATGCMAWVARYALRCRFEVDAGGIRFFGFLPSKLVPFEDLEEIAVVTVPPRSGSSFDWSHLRIQSRRGLAPFKLSLTWEGADDVVAVLEHLSHVHLRREEAS